MSDLEGAWLPPEICFEHDGHATDAVLAAIADGEVAIVPAAALAHVEACDDCGQRLGAAAMLSVDAGAALRRVEAQVEVEAQIEAPMVAAVVPVPATVVPIAAPRRRARRPLPVAAIAVASLVVLVTAVPMISDAIGAAPSIVAGAAATVPFVVRVGGAILRGVPWGHGLGALAVRMVPAMFFVLAGLSVARWSGRARTVRGGVG
jgi:hypothetical protein